MRSIARWSAEQARGTWQRTRAEVGARPLLFGALTGGVFLGYLALILALNGLSVGRLPNVFVAFDVIEGLSDSLTLPMPLGARWETVAEQPLVLVAYMHPLLGRFDGQYTLTLRVTLTLLLMSCLMAAHVLVLVSLVRLRRAAGMTLGGACVGTGGTGLILGGAGAAAMACCGSAGLSITASLLGSGMGATATLGSLVVKHAGVFGGLGIALMLLNLWVVSTLLARGRCASVAVLTDSQSHGGSDGYISRLPSRGRARSSGLP